MTLSRDEWQSLIETHYDKDKVGGAESRPSDLAFFALVELADHVYQLYVEESAASVNLDDPNSFKPQTLAGVPHGFALFAGLMDHMMERHPDGIFDIP